MTINEILAASPSELRDFVHYTDGPGVDDKLSLVVDRLCQIVVEQEDVVEGLQSRLDKLESFFRQQEL